MTSTLFDLFSKSCFILLMAEAHIKKYVSYFDLDYNTSKAHQNQEALFL